MKKYIFRKRKKQIKEEQIQNTPSNAVYIDKENIAVKRDLTKCINCGVCKSTCIDREGYDFEYDGSKCLNCGQCIQFCPTGALCSKSPYNRIMKAKKEGKILVCYTSPAVRVSLKEAFEMEPGVFLQDKLIGLLRMLGFDYVIDTTFGADLTIMEESSELIDRIKNNKKLPMFTSCCPSWVKYAKIHYPELLKNISTCKSPIAMESAIVKTYFAKKNKINSNKIFSVALTPCTAKKAEIKLEKNYKTDEVLTISELIDIIKKQNIKYEDILPSEYDSVLGEGSGSGVIFGTTGGVMEAALRNTYFMLSGKNLEEDKINFKKVRGMNNVKEATININDTKLNVCVIHEISNAKEILDEVKNGTSKYHYIEIMNCYGGCIGGGGEPKYDSPMEQEVKEKRMKALYDRDKIKDVKCAHDNKDIKRLYREYLKKPLSKTSKRLLHTTHNINKK